MIMLDHYMTNEMLLHNVGSGDLSELSETLIEGHEFGEDGVWTYYGEPDVYP